MRHLNFDSRKNSMGRYAQHPERRRFKHIDPAGSELATYRSPTLAASTTHRLCLPRLKAERDPRSD
jgi:hypothetical protein